MNVNEDKVHGDPPYESCQAELRIAVVYRSRSRFVLTQSASEGAEIGPSRALRANVHCANLNRELHILSRLGSTEGNYRRTVVKTGTMR